MKQCWVLKDQYFTFDRSYIPQNLQSLIRSRKWNNNTGEHHKNQNLSRRTAKDLQSTQERGLGATAADCGVRVLLDYITPKWNWLFFAWFTAGFPDIDPSHASLLSLPPGEAAAEIKLPRGTQSGGVWPEKHWRCVKGRPGITWRFVKAQGCDRFDRTTGFLHLPASINPLDTANINSTTFWLQRDKRKANTNKQTWQRTENWQRKQREQWFTVRRATVWTTLLSLDVFCRIRWPMLV